MPRALALTLLLALGACGFFWSPMPRYVVFFAERSGALDDNARAVVAEAARRALEHPASSITVIGFTDSAGSPAADVMLSEQRAKAVADALVSQGVNAGRLRPEGHGQTGEDPGVASRRVEIRIEGS